jgi:hypothetical protein
MARADRRRRLRIVRRRIGAAVLPVLAPATLRALAKSWRVEVLGAEQRDQAFAGPGMLATLWHGRMLLPLPAHRDQGLCVLVSPSDDGALITSLLARFGYRTIRGSSNKNPARAIREMLDGLRGGGRIVITPDGPRGPRHSVNPGPAWMARETGFPILPLGCAADRSWHLKSWDRFTIPKLGARVALAYGQPLRVPSGASDAELAQATEEMKRRLLAAEEQAFRHLGREPDW